MAVGRKLQAQPLSAIGWCSGFAQMNIATRIQASKITAQKSVQLKYFVHLHHFDFADVINS